MPDIRAGGRKRWSDKHTFTVRTGWIRAVKAANDVCQTSAFADMKRSGALPILNHWGSKRTLDSANFIRRESTQGSDRRHGTCPTQKYAGFSRLERVKGSCRQGAFASEIPAACVTNFLCEFRRLSVGYDTVPFRLSRVLLPAVQGQTRRKPGTQSFRSVSSR
jgi:hypothetical protein